MRVGVFLLLDFFTAVTDMQEKRDFPDKNGPFLLFVRKQSFHCGILIDKLMIEVTPHN